MSEAYTGGCACGAIRYEIAAEPVFMNDCQCRDCQHKSGTGHGSYLTFENRRSVKLTGEARQRDIVGDHRPCEDTRLLPDLRVTGVYEVHGNAGPVHRACGESR